MSDYIKPEMAVLLIMTVPGIIGGILAANRGRSVILWAILSAIFPIFIMIVWFEKPVREVEGKFKKCISCGEWLKWKDVTCKYCQAGQPQR